MQLASSEFAAVRGLGPAAWPCQRSSLTTTAASSKKNPAAAAVCCAASRHDDGGSGRLVDEGMAVLRRRIHEMRAAERGSWDPPAEWSAWEESECYASYDGADDVGELAAAVQALLTGARPGVGVGFVAALALAVPASAFVLVSHLLLHASRGMLSNLPH